MPLLSLCMIVRNEEKWLESCLSSVKGLVDEIIVVDTGSSDKTKEIALSFGAKIYDFVWINDFSAARNESLKHATGDWILVLDADEIIVPEEHEKIKDLLKSKGVVAYSLLQRNYTHDRSLFGFTSVMKGYPYSREFRGWFDCTIVRLFQNLHSIYFKGEVHEVVDESLIKLSKQGMERVLVPIVIHHYGEGKGEVAMVEKRKLYQKLCEQKVKSDPQNVQAHLQLGAAYRLNAEFLSAEKSYQEVRRLDPNLFTPLIDLAVCLQKQKKLVEAISMYQTALNKNSICPEAYFGLGICYFLGKELDQAASSFELAIKLNPVYLDAYVSLGAVYERQGHLDKAGEIFNKALNINPDCAQVYYNFGVVWEKAGNIPKAIFCYSKAVDLNYSRKEELINRIDVLKNHNKP